MQLLFQLDMNPAESSEAVFDDFWRGRDIDAHQQEFAESLVRGVREHLVEIDDAIRRALEHWDIGRIGAVERNVIRLAVFELRHRADIPPAVSINEAVDLAKYFSSSESGRFVNGILDRVRKEPPRTARPASDDE